MTAHEVLKKYWGYDDFRPCQLEIIQSVLSGHDTLGLLPTGGGKSITFQVPAMMLPGLTVVVTPLVSLMKDQVDNLRDRGIRGVYIYSGLTRREVTLAYA
jgi:ATP-dependent DNA helicase RecQ